MTIAPTLPLVTVDEYLGSSWHPDREYVDGVLVERTVPTYFHALLQIIIGSYFRRFERQYRFKVLPELRTQIIEGARYRIPDILLCATPIPPKRVLTVTPMVVVEVLSPDDRTAETLQRFRDYSNIGVLHIIQMDPEACVSHRFSSGSLIETQFTNLHLPNLPDPLPFDSEAIFAQLRQELADASA